MLQASRVTRKFTRDALRCKQGSGRPNLYPSAAQQAQRIPERPGPSQVSRSAAAGRRIAVNLQAHIIDTTSAGIPQRTNPALVKG